MSTTTQRLKRIRVLVVTGLLGSAEFIEAYATACGIRCDTAPRGHSAVTAMKQALLVEHPYEMVFVERLLPDMDAFEFAKRIKQDPLLANSKLILVSSFDSAARDDAAIQAGFVENIAKPMKQAHVLAIIRAVIEGKPLIVVEEQKELVKEQVAPAVARGQHMILVAEDNPVNQKVALLQLKELGFFGIVVANGREAVEVVKQADFDAVLMDCGMPEMDGFEATRQIRQWEKTVGKRVPVIAMTASATSDDREQCIEAGMDDYLSKPVTYDKLESVLSKWVNSEGGSICPLDPQGATGEPDLQAQEPGNPVDISALSDLLGPEEAVGVLQLFVSSTEELISQIKDASERRDAKTLKEAAHQLKGSASSVGASTIARTCLELETCAGNEQWEGVPQLNAGLAQNFENAKSYIQTLNS